jgi:hypothetical protein
MKLLFLFLIFLSCETALYAQQATSVTGGNISGTGGSVSYTIGQVAYTNLQNSSGAITQGVQQPFEIVVVTGCEDAANVTFPCSVYPNPAFEQVTLKIEKSIPKNLHVFLNNAEGKHLQNLQVTDQETLIQMDGLPTGTYLLEIYDSQKVIRSFKIIKTLH